MDTKQAVISMLLLFLIASGCAAIQSDTESSLQLESESDHQDAETSFEADERPVDLELVSHLVSLIREPTEELESVSAHTVGLTIFEYPDIDAGIQQLLSDTAKTALLFELIQLQDLDARARRRSYYAIQAICLSERGDPLPVTIPSYMAGRLDERLPNERDAYARGEIEISKQRLLKLIELKIPDETR